MNPDRRKRPPATRGFDLTGHSVWRVLRQDAIFRVLPFGNFGGGPNLRYVLRLLGLHAVGGITSMLRLRLEAHAGALRAQWRKRRR